MRLIPLVSAALLLLLPPQVAAQDWIEYTSLADRFIVNLPGQPTVRDVPFPTEFGVTLTGHAHVYENGKTRYSVTMVDYSNIQKMHADRVKGCTAYPDQCTNQGNAELRGAIDYAVSGFLKRPNIQVTYYAYANSDRIEGRRLQFTSPDKSRTFVAIYLHENRLYILDGTVPPGATPPAMFQQSMGFYDKDGVRVRYETIYSNFYPAPPREPGSGRLQGCE